MTSKTKILIASRSAAALKVLSAALAGADDLICQTKLVSNGHADPLHNVSSAPDLLILRFDTEHLAELAALADTGAAKRPPLLVVGPGGSSEAFRLSVRAGALDFLAEPISNTELLASIRRIRGEQRAKVPSTNGDLVTVIGAAGGVGASFIAANLAHVMALETKAPVALVDLDTTCAPLAGLFDALSERGLLEAMIEADTLDGHALSGYMARHRSGVHILGALSNRALIASELDPVCLSALTKTVSANYANVVVDVQHCLNVANATVLSEAKNVVLVLQQSVVQVRNAARLVKALTSELGLSRDAVRVVLNRQQKNSAVTTEDVQRALSVREVFAIPSQYDAAVASMDSGIPLLEFDSSSHVGRALLELQASLRGVERPARTGLMSRVLPGFMRN